MFSVGLIRAQHEIIDNKNAQYLIGQVCSLTAKYIECHVLRVKIGFQATTVNQYYVMTVFRFS